MLYHPDCKSCDGEGCPECNGAGRVNRWRECARAEYLSEFFGAGGFDSLVPLSSYTCPDGDEWTYGRKIVTTWGLLDGTPVAHHEVTNDDPRADRSTDAHRYWIWNATGGS